MKNLAIFIKVSILALIILFSFNASAEHIWKYAKGGSPGEVLDIQTDSIGNAYIIGTFTGTNFIYRDFTSITVDGKTGNDNIFLLKTSPEGKTIWLNSIYSSDKACDLSDIRLSVNYKGEAVVSAKPSTNTTLTCQKTTINVDSNDVVIVKSTSTGLITKINRLNIKNKKGNKLAEVNLNDIILDNYGNIYVTGGFKGDSLYFYDPDDGNTKPRFPFKNTNFIIPPRITVKQYLVNTSPVNQSLFVAKYGPLGYFTDGSSWGKGITVSGLGTFGCFGRKLQVYKDTVLLTAQYFASLGTTLNFLGNDLANKGSFNALVACINPNGTSKWSQEIYGSDNILIDNIHIAKNKIPVGKLFKDDFIVYTTLFTDASNITCAKSTFSTSAINSKHNCVVLKFSSLGIYTNNIVIKTAIPEARLKFTKYNSYIGTTLQKPKLFGGEYYNYIYVISEFFATEPITGIATILNFDTDGTKSDILITKINSSTMSAIDANAINAFGDNNLEAAFIDPKTGYCYIGGSTINEINTRILGGSIFKIDKSALGGFFIMSTNNTTLDVISKYYQQNSATNNVTVKNMFSDEYGSMYVAGKYTGEDASVGKTGNIFKLGSNTYPSGTFTGKFAQVTTISGTVTDIKGNPITNGYVKVYGYTRFHKSPQADSVKLNINGQYTISEVPFGRYLIYASPFTANFGDFAPTYFPSTTYWELATPIYIDTENPIDMDTIIVKERPKHNGNSNIGGNVSTLDESDLKSTMGKPARQASVILMQKKPKEDFDLVVAAMTVTDADGNFSFTGVDNGEYALLVDETGLPSQMYDPVTIVDGTTYNLDFIIEEDSVSAPSPPPVPSIIEGITETLSGFIIFPNPSYNGIVKFKAINTDKIFSIEVFDLTGKTIKSETNIITEKIFDLSEFYYGTYIFKIVSGDEIKIHKVIIK
jgi:hypothetical protein